MTTCGPTSRRSIDETNKAVSKAEVDQGSFRILGYPIGRSRAAISTPSLKVKRNVVLDDHADVVEQIYSGSRRSAHQHRIRYHGGGPDRIAGPVRRPDPAVAGPLGRPAVAGARRGGGRGLRVRRIAPWPASAAPAVESVVCVIAVLGTGLHDSPILPALLGPAFVAGLTAGISGSVLTCVLPGLTLLAACVAGYRGTDYVAASATWTVLAAAAGTGGCALRQITAGKHRDAVEPSYAAAYRLISQLRLVARQLSAGLDPVSLATDARAVQPGSRRSTAGGPTSGRPDSRLPAAVRVRGAGRLGWDGRRGPGVREAWASSNADTTRAQPADAADHRQLGGDAAAIGLRTFGLVGLETAK